MTRARRNRWWFISPAEATRLVESFCDMSEAEIVVALQQCGPCQSPNGNRGEHTPSCGCELELWKRAGYAHVMSEKP